MVSTNYTITSGYTYKVYSELFENNISSLGFYIKGASSLSDKDIKII